MPSGPKEGLSILKKTSSVPMVGSLWSAHSCPCKALLDRGGSSLAYADGISSVGFMSTRTLKSLAKKCLCSQMHLQNATCGMALLEIHHAPWPAKGSEKSCTREILLL